MYLYLDSKNTPLKKLICSSHGSHGKLSSLWNPETIGSLAKEVAVTKQQGVGSKYQGIFSTSTGSIALSRIKGSQSLRKRAFAKLTHPFEADFLFRFKGSKPKRSLVLSWYLRYLSSTGETKPLTIQDLAGHGTLWASPVLSSTFKKPLRQWMSQWNPGWFLKTPLPSFLL